MTTYDLARSNMLQGQIRPNKVTDYTLIDALAVLPRELFVAKAMRGVAYVDKELPVGNGRYMIEPMVLARMIQSLDISRQDRVLNVGCVTGYSAALLAQLVDNVVATDPEAEFLERAKETLKEIGVENVELIHAGIAEGAPARGPFNVVLVCGAMNQVPDSLLEQLADGGKLIAVIANPNGMLGHVTLYRRTGKAVAHRVLFEASCHVLPGFEIKSGFTL